MPLHSRKIHRPLDNGGLQFFEEMPMIVTSSPIEGKLREDPDSHSNQEPAVKSDIPWCSMLQSYYSHSADNHSNRDVSETFESSSSSSSRMYPVAEHKVAIALLNNNEGLKVLSENKKSFKTQNNSDTSKCSIVSEASSASQEIDCNKIRHRIKTGNVNLKDILKYEDFLKKKLTVPENVVEKKKEDGEALGYIEKQLRNLNVTPRTSKLIQKRRREQEKRLVSLIHSKSKSTFDSKITMGKQLTRAQEKIKLREEMEMKQIRAARLRQKALESSTVFANIHGARLKNTAQKIQLNKKTTQLEQKFKSELDKIQHQTNQMVSNVFSTLQKEQYQDLRDQVRSQKQHEKQLLRTSEAQLQRLQSSYENKLKELKDVASARASENSKDKKEINREIARIQKDLRSHFERDFSCLLEKIEKNGTDNRQMREAKSSELVSKILKADYIFDL